MVNWVYNNEEVKSLKEIETILGYRPFGFIYLITLENPKGKTLTYFGQKTLLTDAKRIVGQRELKEKGKKPFRKYKSKKGKKQGEWVYYENRKEETWQTYNSSSVEVQALIESGVKHTKQILKFTTQKSLLNWLEMKQVVCSDCLEDENCLNRRIGNYHQRNIINALKKEK